MVGTTKLYFAWSEMRLPIVVRLSPLPRIRFAIVTNFPRGERARVRGNYHLFFSFVCH